MSKMIWIVLGVSALVSACETPTTQRYAISPDNNLAIRALNAKAVGVRPFVGPENFDSNCRALGPMQVADNLSHTQYIQKAFEDELKIAGVYASDNPHASIGGKLNKIEFSSSKGISSGYWLIDITLDSSNGKKINISEYYEFNSGFVATEACRNTAEAYSRAVQNLVGKAVRSLGFNDLLK